MKLLRYKGCAGRVLNVWEYDAEHRTVRAKVMFGSALPIDLEFTLCTEQNPRLGAYCVSRRTDAWQVSPAAYNGTAFKVAPLHPNVPVDFFYLWGAPSFIEEALASL